MDGTILVTGVTGVTGATGTLGRPLGWGLPCSSGAESLGKVARHGAYAY